MKLFQDGGIPGPGLDPFQWIEFFAGKAEATKAFQRRGYKTARLDINYMDLATGNNPMDLLTDAGFGLLGPAD